MISALTPTDPTRLGSWTLRGRLGSGGMATVYLGERQGAYAAVKAVHPHIADDAEFRLRFRREIEVCEQVHGAQVAPLLDADADGVRPWLAVQYVAGPTLAQFLQAHGPLTGEALRALCVGLLEAIHQLHSAGVVHRDLKASNVILAAETPVIIDFGIARADQMTQVTTTGMSIGTPGWMSPEQLAGIGVGQPADVFAWGVLAAVAATGRLPWGDGDSAAAMTYRIVHGDPDLDGVADWLRPAVAAALHRDAGARATITDLRTLLGVPEPGAAGALIEAAWSPYAATELALPHLGQAPSQLPARPRRRGPGAWIAGLAAVLVLGIGGGLLAWQLTRDDDTPGPSDLSSEATDPRYAQPITAGTQDYDAFVSFAYEHQSSPVVLNIQFAGNEPELTRYEVSGAPAVQVCAQTSSGVCREGLLVVVRDLDQDTDSRLTEDTGLLRLYGRFVVVSITGPLQGTTTVELRAVPTG